MSYGGLLFPNRFETLAYRSRRVQNTWTEGCESACSALGSGAVNTSGLHVAPAVTATLGRMSSTSGDDPTSHDGDDFLAANRAERAKIRAEADRKSEKKTPKPDESGEHGTDEPQTGAPAAIGSARSGALVPSLIAAVVVLAVAAAVFAYLAFGSSSDDADDLDGAGAVRDAKSYAAQMLTYETGKYDDLDRRIRAISTPEFADTYIKSSQQARAANDAAHASSKGSAETAGIVSTDDGEAVVLVALDNTVTSPQAPALGEGSGAYESRVKITLTQDDGKWLVSDFEVV